KRHVGVYLFACPLPTNQDPMQSGQAILYPCGHRRRMMASRRRMIVAFGVLVLGLQSCAVCLVANAGVRSTHADVVLGAGRLAGFRWTAETYRSKSGHAASRPCLHIGFRPIHPPANPDPLETSVESTGCGPLHPTPDLVSLVDEVHKPKMTAIVMGFPLV